MHVWLCFPVLVSFFSYMFSFCVHLFSNYSINLNNFFTLCKLPLPPIFSSFFIVIISAFIPMLTYFMFFFFFCSYILQDVDTIYLSQDTRELNLQDFVHLENRLETILYSMCDLNSSLSDQISDPFIQSEKKKYMFSSASLIYTH